MKIGDTFSAGCDQKVTVLAFDASEEILLILLERSGEPFVVVNNYDIQNGYMSWVGSRYKRNIIDATRTFCELAKIPFKESDEGE